MNESENIFAGILGIIYLICVFIEIKSMKKNKIDIFYKNNFLLVLIASCVFPFALFVFAYGFYNLINIILTHQEIEFCGTLKNKRIRTINLLGKQKVIKL